MAKMRADLDTVAAAPGTQAAEIAALKGVSPWSDSLESYSAAPNWLWTTLAM